jgi:hypothetical protein
MAGEAYQHRHGYRADVLMAEQGRVKRCECSCMCTYQLRQPMLTQPPPQPRIGQLTFTHTVSAASIRP